MNKESFYAVVDLIKGDPVFQRKGKKPQQPVAHQVALVLNRLGTTGNGSSVGATAQKFGYSVGSVEKFTERVLTALYNLANEYIAWPDGKERKDIARRAGDRYGFPGCVGFLDGTHFIFTQKPGIDGEVYFTRKQRYAINAQIVCDDRKQIRYIYSGLYGSRHDSRAWSQSLVSKYPGFYFSEGQYLMADSACALTKFCMKP